MENFVKSFNASVAKPLIERQAEKMKSVHDLSVFPEQYVNYIDFSDSKIFKKKFVLKESLSLRSQIDSVIVNYLNRSINAEQATLEVDSKIDKIVEFFEDILQNHKEKLERRHLDTANVYLLEIALPIFHKIEDATNNHRQIKEFFEKSFLGKVLGKIDPEYRDFLRHVGESIFKKEGESYSLSGQRLRR